MDTHLQAPLVGAEPAIVPEPLSSDRIADIARRALWNPTKVTSAEIQLLAASVLAQIGIATPASAAPPAASAPP